MLPILNRDVFLHPFALGLYLGLIFAALALYRSFGLQRELRRYRRHLSDKLEIDADSVNKLRVNQEKLRSENENLRIKIAAFNEEPDRRAHRDLEIFARAEKHLLVSVPGFAPAWENARQVAQAELAEEEAGRSLSKRVFGKIFTASPRPDSDKLLSDPGKT
jgi:hypothetical protein